MLALGRSLKMPVLAEGIAPAQWDFVLSAGCDKGQRYLFAQPVPVSKLPDAMEAAALMAYRDGFAAATPPVALAVA